jgi:hypothetical protein
VALHKYVLYGLGIHTEVPLWGEEVEDCPADVRIAWRIDENPIPDSRPGRQVSSHESEREIRFSWPGIATMFIRRGREIEIETGAREGVNHARHLIAGLGMGLILHQRGVFTLHASTIAIGRSAVGIAGSKRSGKSTTAAALTARGHTLLSDDVLALAMPENDAPRVLPGPRTINLWPDTLQALGQDPADLPMIWPRSTKRISMVPVWGARENLPLRCIFFLELSKMVEEPSVERLEPGEAVRLLIGHSHALRMIEDREAMPQHLLQCGRVAQDVGMFRLRRPRSLDSIQDVARLIENRLESLISMDEMPARASAS